MKQHPHPFTLDTPLFLLDPEPKRWHIQWRHPGKFYAQDERMTQYHLDAVLAGRCWIASFPQPNGVVDRIEFDLDRKKAEHAGEMVARYLAIRELLGPERPPLVVRTPSGGIHLSYRIPEIELSELVEGLESGLVPEVLQSAGLAIGRGAIEIFPQRKQAKRLPVGRRMAILDPATLKPIVVAPESPSADDPTWLTFHDALRQWHGRVLTDLLPHLRRLPRECNAGTASKANRSAISSPSPELTQGIRPASAELIAEGLTRPSSRYEVEFRVGAGFWRDPGLMPRRGGGASATREQVAHGLALWLAENHNGCSKEWSEDLRRNPVDKVIDLWTERYLQPGPDGRAPVDRMLSAALAESRDCGMVAPADLDDISLLGEDLFGRGPFRYQFEVWVCSLFRAVKSIERYQRAHGGEVVRGEGFIEAEILSGWMERWPWGSGRARGTRNYVTFREALVSRGWMVPVSPPRWCVQVPEFTGEATRYRVRPPRNVREGELLYSVGTVERRITAMKVNGRALTVEEAYHALRALGRGPSLERRYGAAAAELITRYANAIRDPFGTSS